MFLLAPVHPFECVCMFEDTEVSRPLLISRCTDWYGLIALVSQMRSNLNPTLPSELICNTPDCTGSRRRSKRTRMSPTVMGSRGLPSQTRVPLSALARRLPAGPSDTFNTVCHAAFFADENYKCHHVYEQQRGLSGL